MSNFVDQGIALAEKAVAADNEQEYEKACSNYIQALEYFKHAIEFEKNDVAKVKLQSYFEQYLARVEYLRSMLDEQKKHNNNAQGSNNGGSLSANKDDADNDDKANGSSVDKDTLKLRGALAEKIMVTNPNVRWCDVAG